MIEGSLSRRYSKALFQLALEEKREEVVSQEIERFRAAYVSSPLQSVLNNPAFHVESRKQVLLAVAKAWSFPHWQCASCCSCWTATV
jgi:F0F1-type ATP synthase delta subunit